jgi:hypothetical protein
MSNEHADSFLNLLMSRKGQIVTLVTERPMKVRKNQLPITKRSEFQCRVGVNYDNIKAVQEKRETGELPAENAGLPWGEWVEFPYVISHKGELYLRCTVLNNDFYREPVYTQQGDVISRETAQEQCLASEFSARGDNEVFTVKLSSVLSVK